MYRRQEQECMLKRLFGISGTIPELAYGCMYQLKTSAVSSGRRIRSNQTNYMEIGKLCLLCTRANLISGLNLLMTSILSCWWSSHYLAEQAISDKEYQISMLALLTTRLCIVHCQLMSVIWNSSSKYLNDLVKKCSLFHIK